MSLETRVCIAASLFQAFFRVFLYNTKKRLKIQKYNKNSICNYIKASNASTSKASRFQSVELFLFSKAPKMKLKVPKNIFHLINHISLLTHYFWPNAYNLIFFCCQRGISILVLLERTFRYILIDSRTKIGLLCDVTACHISFIWTVSAIFLKM